MVNKVYESKTVKHFNPATNQVRNCYEIELPSKCNTHKDLYLRENVLEKYTPMQQATSSSVRYIKNNV